ncbi:hypothetical protein [Tabrizicola sp.]|uniref:hypothetical protein n=1 Tax=Tabrizicola sp. TaxID=2005166 RepID=UPI001A53A959|nr:hypothetical protein [Tabrizicola sp.]MBL9074100.1 hypothetical protein [Tabrizicola sp.]
MPRPQSRLSLVALVLCVASLLAGCQLTGPGKGASGPPAGNPLTGGEIEVTALDAPSGGTVAAAGTEPVGTDKAAAQSAPQSDAGTAPAAGGEPGEDPGSPAPKSDLQATPVTPKSEMQLACEKKKGSWSGIGKGDARACVFRTRDGGKRCDRESQCDGVCLARSGTCSPLKPLYGCNEILQDNGARVTLCLD